MYSNKELVHQVGKKEKLLVLLYFPVHFVWFMLMTQLGRNMSEGLK